ncbi:MAG: D-Ala-D-Ala carboxypeptidase family metallohydrolase [Hyphomicrobiales bacterium]
MVCLATFVSACAVTEEASFDTGTLESATPTVQTKTVPDPAGITADVSPEIVTARAAGLPYPLPNSKFLASEKVAYLAAQAVASAPTQQAAAKPVTETVKVAEGDVTGSTQTTSASQTLVVENNKAHAAAQKLALSQASAKTTKLNQNSKAASLPGVELKTGLEGTPEKKPDATRVAAGRLQPSLPTLASYASYSVANGRVSTKCFPGRLRKILGQVHHRFGKKPEVSSGYRSPAYNRRIGGSRGSYHTKCLAADIKVRGVDKYVLAKYIRSLPDRGGVGVYGCKGVVHVDVGPRRNWYYRCRKRRG